MGKIIRNSLIIGGLSGLIFGVIVAHCTLPHYGLLGGLAIFLIITLLSIFILRWSSIAARKNEQEKVQKEEEARKRKEQTMGKEIGSALLVGGLIGLIAGAVIGWLSDMPVFGAVIGLAILSFFLWVAISSHKDDQKKAQKEEEARKRKEQEEKERKIRLDRLKETITQGKWDFPTRKFYDKCKEAHCTDLNDEYSITKATNIAVELIREVCPGIDKSSCAAYLQVEKMTEFMAVGGKQYAVDMEAREKAMRTPRPAKGTKEEMTFIQRARALETCTGVEKRKKMLTDLISDYNAKIKAIREGEEAMKTLGLIYMDQQKKESSWAIMGGIAEGIAGSAAGVAAAINTMEENAKIREYNEGMRRASRDVLSGAAQLSGSRYELEEELNRLKKQHAEAEEKICLKSPNSKEIWSNIRIGSAYVVKNESGVLTAEVTITQKKDFALNVPEQVQMVVDGTLTGTVFSGETNVGKICFPLPIYGFPINTGSRITLDGICTNTIEKGENFTVELDGTQNLWVMEC